MNTLEIQVFDTLNLEISVLEIFVKIEYFFKEIVNSIKLNIIEAFCYNKPPSFVLKSFI